VIQVCIGLLCSKHLAAKDKTAKVLPTLVARKNHCKGTFRTTPCARILGTRVIKPKVVIIFQIMSRGEARGGEKETQTESTGHCSATTPTRKNHAIVAKEK